MSVHLRRLALLSLALAGLLSARWLHTQFNHGSRAYYLWLNQGALASGDQAEPMNCDVIFCIQELSQQAPQDGVVQVGACDLFMYNGGVAVSGFLGFLTVYLLFVLGGGLLHQVLPGPWRRAFLLGWSALFLAVALPLRPAIWLLQVALTLLVVALLPLAPRLRAALFLTLGLGTLGTVGREIVEACNLQFFRLSRLSLDPAWQEASDSWREVLDFLQLGRPGEPPTQLEGFPFLFLALALLLKGFRRVLWLAYESWTGTLPAIRPLDFLLYLVGLPALIGNAATPSYREFQRAREQPLDPLSGPRTLAWCAGAATLLYVAVVMLGYSPAVRVLFPRCDLEQVGAGFVWLRLSTVYVVEYLFLLATEQTSIGVARLFGYGLKDNYLQPLTARGMADFWRRWNIYWREFLVRVFFWPITLGLARRAGCPRGWHLAAAAMGTFAGTFVLNVVPLLLLSGFLQDQFYVAQATQPGPGIVDPGIEPQHTRWRAVLPSLALYYLLEGLLVSLSLWWEHRTQVRAAASRDSEPQASPWPARILATAATFLVVAALRVFLTDSMTLDQQLELLTRAFLGR